MNYSLKRNKIYICHLLTILSLFATIAIMFIIQFRVEGLQDQIAKANNKISSYEDKIELLEVEWVYLTRPDRVRTLASRYLHNNSYTMASQIRAIDDLEKYRVANYQKKINLKEDSKSQTLIN